MTRLGWWIRRDGRLDGVDEPATMQADRTALGFPRRLLTWDPALGRGLVRLGPSEGAWRVMPVGARDRTLAVGPAWDLPEDPTVPMTVAPSAAAHWQAMVPTPPAAAWNSTVVPGPTL